MTKWILFDSMCHGTQIVLDEPNQAKLPVRGIVNMIEREDGSGHNFNVRLHNSVKSVFVRTID